MHKIFDKPRFSGDGTKWGVSDFYEEHERRLKAALKLGIDFDTDWFSSKKEIASGRVTRQGTMVTCEVSVSDDFDTEGNGEISFEIAPGMAVEDLFDRVVNELDNAHEDANHDLKDNEPYYGFSVGPAGPDGKWTDWAYTFITPRGVWRDFLGSPPGDCYSWWGWEDLDPEARNEWQDEPEREHPLNGLYGRYSLPPFPAFTLDTRGKLAAWAYQYDEDTTPTSFEADGWIIQAWKEE